MVGWWDKMKGEKMLEGIGGRFLEGRTTWWELKHGRRNLFTKGQRDEGGIGVGGREKMKGGKMLEVGDFW